MNEPAKPATVTRQGHPAIRLEARSSSGTQCAPSGTLVIFGAGGDLTKRLLMPALYDLAGSQLLDARFQVIGIDLADNTDEGWRASLTETMQSFTKDPTAEFYTPKIDPRAWDFVRNRLTYLQGDFGKPEVYRELARRLNGNVVFYLAINDRFFGPVVDRLGEAALLKQKQGVFRRVVIEKPFGRDLNSAKALNAQILKQADESQFYRIDHFLGKETVESILAIRFANALFEPIWCKEYIDRVEITAAETIGVEERGAFYETTGALRDMVPNHLFQLVCMIGIEPPSSLDAEAFRDEKARLMQQIRPVPPSDAARGQYGAGGVQGREVSAYRAEPHVAPESRTETYVAVKLSIDNARWAGVPFYLRTGKRLAARQTQIALVFKPASIPPFARTQTLAQNIVRLQIDPVQGMKTDFSAKVPGPAMRLGHVAPSFCYSDFFTEPPNVGYETLLYDCMMGDATLFQRADYIEASWAVVDPLLKAWGQGMPQVYASGSGGPSSADELLARDGRRWLPLDRT
jgi:glucose-6-phosphate 1-dehydrogenase